MREFPRIEKTARELKRGTQAVRSTAASRAGRVLIWPLVCLAVACMCTFGVLTLRAWIFQQGGEASASARGAMDTAMLAVEASVEMQKEDSLRLWLELRGMEQSEVENILRGREVKVIGDSRGVVVGGSAASGKSSAMALGGRGGGAMGASSAPMLMVGPGETYQTLQAAWNAAQDGDVIGVMPGASYAGFSTYGNYDPKSVRFVAQRVQGVEPPVITGSVDIWDNGGGVVEFEGLVFRPKEWMAAVYANYAVMRFVNCLFDGRGLWYSNPMVVLNDSDIELIHCTLFGSEELVYASWTELFIKNSILWNKGGNGSGVSVGGQPQPEAEDSIIRGGWFGSQLVEDAPISKGGFLRKDSEARNAAEAGWCDVDIYGRPRPQDGAADMGCSEFDEGRIAQSYEYLRAGNPHGLGIAIAPTKIVDATGTGGNVYATLQAALGAIEDGDVVKIVGGVHPGFSLDSAGRDVLFLGGLDEEGDPPIIEGNVGILWSEGGLVMFEGIVFRLREGNESVGLYEAETRFLNCLFDSGGHEWSLSSIVACDSDVRLTHCTLLGNETLVYAYTYFSQAAKVSIRNSILWGDCASAVEAYGQVEVSAWHSIVKGWQGGGSNVSAADPLLTSEGWLAEDSTAALGKAEAGWAAVDILGWPRPFRDDNQPVAAPDIGCAEFIDYEQDGDNNGIADWWEWRHFGRVGVDPDELAPSGNGSAIMQNYLAGTNPNDYYDHPSGRIVPQLSIVGGNNQASDPEEFLPQPLAVLVKDSVTGLPLMNAPVKFVVVQGGGKLTAAPSFNEEQYDSVEVRTNEYGKASICYLQPAVEGVVSTIKASAPQTKPAVFTATVLTIAAPVVGIVGGSQSIVWPEKEATLEATAVDLGGLPLTTKWSVVSGTGTVEFEDAQALSTTVTFDYPGVYVLEFSASSGSKSASVQTTVTVDPGSEPAVRFISPADGTVVEIGETITFKVEASSPDSPIAQVTLYRDDEVVASYTKGLDGTITIPRSESLSDTYTYTAVATDTNGNTASASTSATSRNTSGSEEVESEIGVAVLMDNSTASKSGLVPTVPMLVLVGTTSFRVLPGVVREEKVSLKKWTNHSIVVNSEGQPWPRCAEYDPGTGKGCGEITCFECEFTDENYLFRHAIGNVLLEGQFALDFTAGDGHWKVQNWGTSVGALWGPGASYSHPYHGGGVSYLSVNPIQTSFVQETEKGSGVYEELRYLPVWTPDDGTNGDVVVTSDSSAALIGEAVFKLGDPLDPTTANFATFECTLGGVEYAFVLEKTSSNPLVYSEEDGYCQVTITSHSGSTPLASMTLNVTITSPWLQQPVTCALKKMDPDDNAFTNFTVEIVDRTPPDPTQCHSGVFYVRMTGPDLDGAGVKLKVGVDEEIVFEMSSMPNVSDTYISPPLLIKNMDGAGASTMSASLPSSQSPMQGSAITGASTPMAAASSSTTPLIIAANGTIASVWVGSAAPLVHGTARMRKPAFLGAALNETDFAAFPAGDDHFEKLDAIIGRKSGFLWQTPPKLGYSSSTIDKKVTLAKLQKVLSNHSIFYLFAHGYASNEINSDHTTFQGFYVWSNDGKKRNHLVTTADIVGGVIGGAGDNTYNLVFINACASANESHKMAAKYARAFKTRNYVGWSAPVTIATAAPAAEEFFNQLKEGVNGNKTVKAAIKGITATQIIQAHLFSEKIEIKQPLTHVENHDFTENDENIIIDNTKKK